MLISCYPQLESDVVCDANMVCKANLLPHLDIPAETKAKRSRSGKG
nr:hypothetical protein [Tanacetum cinerariifolium]